MFTIYAISSGVGLWELGKTLCQAKVPFWSRVLAKVKKAPSGVGAWHRVQGRGRVLYSDNFGSVGGSAR